MIPPVKKTLLVFLLTVTSAHALETDNYLVWGRTLPDSAEEVNEVLEKEITEVISAISTKEQASCEDITFRIARRFKTTPRRKLFEDWSERHLSHQMYPETPYYLAESIYRNTSRIYLNHSGLSPNLQVNGIYFGVDKLSHFASTGRRYLAKYLKKIRKGYTDEEAVKSAIRFGLKNEARILGMWPSGVFSYGDMEANFQGFTFWKKMCLDETDPYLRKEGGKWELVKKPDIRDYVNPYWDETFNLSYRDRGMWAEAKLLIKSEYCPLKEGENVQARMKHYRDLNHSSFSLSYISELQKNRYKHAPVPSETQSVDQLCAE